RAARDRLSAALLRMAISSSARKNRQLATSGIDCSASKDANPRGDSSAANVASRASKSYSSSRDCSNAFSCRSSGAYNSHSKAVASVLGNGEEKRKILEEQM